MRKKSISDMVLECLEARRLKTCAEVVDEINTWEQIIVKSSTVSSCLNRLCKVGMARRFKGIGPRDGYGYIL